MENIREGWEKFKPYGMVIIESSVFLGKIALLSIATAVVACLRLIFNAVFFVALRCRNAASEAYYGCVDRWTREIEDFSSGDL